MRHFDHEEEFHSRDRKQFRKERKIAQNTDRSKFKKTDLETKTIKTAYHLRRGRVIAISGEGAFVDFGPIPESRASEEHKTNPPHTVEPLNREQSGVVLCSLKGLMKKETAQIKNIVSVGDWVRCSDEGAIEQIEERTSSLARTDISGRKEQLIAVNIDQVIITASVVNPPLKPALVDRYLIAAEKGNIHPIILINKIDLLETGSNEQQDLYHEFLCAYAPLGWPILGVSSTTKVGIEALCALLQNKTSVFSGQSGVGKSSLLNACFGLELKTGNLAVKTSKGSHTTTTASLLPLPGGGYCVDTPGIRSFGVWDLTKADIINHFSDLTPIAKKCKYPDCVHVNEPECAVQDALKEGTIPALRYESYINLLEEISSGSKSKTWS